MHSGSAHGVETVVTVEEKGLLDRLELVAVDVQALLAGEVNPFQGELAVDLLDRVRLLTLSQ